MTGQVQTPGQAAYEAVQDHAEWAGWAEAQGYRATGTEYDLIEMASAFKAGMQAARDLDDATLAAEVRAGHVRIETEAPQPAPELAAPEVQFAPCPVDGHDGKHMQWRSGQWTCGHVLANSLILGGILPVPPEGPAPEPPGLRGALVDAMVRWSGRDALDECADDLARILDAHPAPSARPAPGLADAMAERDGLREALTSARVTLQRPDLSAQRRIMHAVRVLTAALEA